MPRTRSTTASATNDDLSNVDHDKEDSPSQNLRRRNPSRSAQKPVEKKGVLTERRAAVNSTPTKPRLEKESYATTPSSRTRGSVRGSTKRPLAELKEDDNSQDDNDEAPTPSKRRNNRDQQEQQVSTPSKHHKPTIITSNTPLPPRTPSSKLQKTNTTHTPTSNRNQQTPRTPRTPASVLREAKTFFKPSSLPLRIIGREQETAKITAFLESTLKRGVGGSLYISGLPGTGKTALLDEILRDWEPWMQKEAKWKCKVVKVNCMTLSDPNQIFGRLLDLFEIPAESFGTVKSEPYKTLEKAFTQKSETRKLLTSYVLVLDEIDYLGTREQSVLYRIFEWASLENSSLVLIGIANQLDLIQKYLPRLGGRCAEPMLLNFNPYGTKEIAEIIRARLRSVQAQMDDEDTTPSTPSSKDKQGGVGGAKVGVPLMQEAAIEMCARKAAGTGDLRKALDVCRQALEVLESDLLKKGMASSKPLSAPSPLGKPIPSNNIVDMNAELSTVLDAPKVTISHVMRATASTTGPGPVQRVSALNFQQKAVLVALLLLSKGMKQSEMVVGKLHDAYIKLCAKKKLFHPVTSTEFGDIISLLETTGLLTLHKAKEEKGRRVEFSVLASQVEQGVGTDPVLAGVLREEMGGGAEKK
ncbi:AAA ATPase [Chytridiales sp. JEL 0842]|nr:AAA ATPase [Chytridiales sp. JEL 0842]